MRRAFDMHFGLSGAVQRFADRYLSIPCRFWYIISMFLVRQVPFRRVADTGI